MPLIFDTFSKSSLLGKTVVALFVMGIIAITIGAFGSHWLTSQQQNLCLISCFLFLAAATAIGIMTETKGGPKSYKKDGELTLADDCIMINNERYPLDEVKWIEFGIGGFNPQTGNTITAKKFTNTFCMHLTDGTVIKKYFIIPTHIDGEDLHDLLYGWKSAGIHVHASGFNLSTKSRRLTFFDWKNERK